MRFSRVCAVTAVTTFLAMTGAPARATATLRSVTATTNAGRTCTVVLRGDSPYQIVPVSSRIDFGASLSCTAPGGVHVRDAWVDSVVTGPASPSLGYVTDTVAVQVGSRVETPGNRSDVCSDFSTPGTCSSAEHTYGYPGTAYRLHFHVGISLPTNGERWTSYPSGCSAQLLSIDPQRTVFTDVLQCLSDHTITAA